MPHVTNVKVNSGNRQCMIKTNTKKRNKNITCTYKDYVVQMTFYASQSHIPDVTLRCIKRAVHIYVLCV